MEEQEVVKKKPGRPFGSVPLMFSKEVQEAVLTGIRLGMSYKDSARAAGITEAIFAAWVNKGRQGVKAYVEFAERADKAIFESKALHLQLINKAARGGHKVTKTTTEKDNMGNVIKTITVTEETLPNVNASKWILERRFSSEFGPKKEVAVTNGDNPFEISLFNQVLVGSATDQEIEEPEAVEKVE
jgi:hypothetical protein